MSDKAPKRPGQPTLNTPEMIEAICERLAQGEALVAICRDPDMPSARSVQNWQDADEALLSQIMRAREIGLHHRAEQAVANAKAAEDAALGRLAFDADRWLIGKLSNGLLSDDKTRKHEIKVNMDEETAAWLGQAS